MLYRILNSRIKAPLQLLAARQAANNSSFSTGRAWIWAVVAVVVVVVVVTLRVLQRGLRRQRAKTLLV